jgi:murein L,D-transpeptidase YcbB/YkuD
VLAELLLRRNAGWQEGAIESYLSSYQERVVRLDEPWSIHLLHWTAWVDEEDTPQFRNDLYGRDEKLARALAAPLKRPAEAGLGPDEENR